MTETLNVDWDSVGGYGPNQTAGHSGSETSEAAALRPKGKRMRSVLEHLEEIGAVGATCREIENFFNIHHGAASGALTRLHRAGLAMRLTETRDKQQVYVALMHVEDRETSPYRPNAAYREDRAPMPLERSEVNAEAVWTAMEEEGLPFHKLAAVMRIVEKFR